ncbi:MAG: hypothetical protein, partial [Olavius algarvensis Gamma 1 endosymbiont]
MNWINISGNTTFDENGNKLTYLPTPAANSVMGSSSFAVTKSDVYFENGEIEFSVKLEDALSHCQLVFNHGLQNKNSIFVGLNYNNAPYGIGVYSSNINISFFHSADEFETIRQQGTQFALIFAR